MSQSVPVIILAGGQGSRIGGNKTAQMLGGLSLIEHMVCKARHYSDEIAVSVARRGDVLLPPEIEEIEDGQDGSGPIAGLASALHFAKNRGHDLVLTLPCDTPFLPDDLLDRLSAGLGRCNAAIASGNDGLHPTCGLWRVDTLAELDDYLAKGRRSLNGFAEAVGYSSTQWLKEPFDPFFNINTPDDLAEAERIASGLEHPIR